MEVARSLAGVQLTQERQKRRALSRRAGNTSREHPILIPLGVLRRFIRCVYSRRRPRSSFSRAKGGISIAEIQRSPQASLLGGTWRSCKACPRSDKRGINKLS